MPADGRKRGFKVDPQETAAKRSCLPDRNPAASFVRLRRCGRITDEDYETAKTVLQSYVHLVALLKDEKTKMHRLRKMLFGASTEKLEHLLHGETQASASTAAAQGRQDSNL